MSGAVLRVGARGSELSLAQTRWVIARLERAHPGVRCEIVTIETHGDRHAGAMAGLPVGSFVTEIERALLEERIDLAVHSLKDMPTAGPEGLVVAAVPERELPHDVLVTREPVDLFSLPEGFVVGTSSPRRAAQMTRHAPQTQVRPIRGNVPTRLEKLKAGEFGGIVLAAAGLARLGAKGEHEIPLPMPPFLPAPGQGALAVQTRAEGAARELAAAVDDAWTRAAVEAERAFLAASGGGCHAALGAWAVVEGIGEDQLRLSGQMFIGGEPAEGEVVGPLGRPEAIGAELARRLLEGGA